MLIVGSWTSSFSSRSRIQGVRVSKSIESTVMRGIRSFFEGSNAAWGLFLKSRYVASGHVSATGEGQDRKVLSFRSLVEPREARGRRKVRGREVSGCVTMSGTSIRLLVREGLTKSMILS